MNGRDIGGIIRDQGLLTQNMLKAIGTLKSIEYPAGSLNKYYTKVLEESKKSKLKETKYYRKIAN